MMTKQKTNKHFEEKSRIHFLISVLCFLGLSALSRIVYLTLIPSQQLNKLATSQYKTTINLAPHRGQILDKSGRSLAVSIKQPSLAINPRVFKPDLKEKEFLLNNNLITREKLKEIGTRKTYFSWLKRKIPQPIADKLSSMKIKGLHILYEPARYYPNGQLASNVLGIVGTDNNGLLGLEQAYNSLLSGDSPKLPYLRDGKGRLILLDTNEAAPEKLGNNVILTIDSVIQEISEKALAHWYKKSLAKTASAIVLDPHTGKILAMANLPSFEPNNTEQLDLKTTINHVTNTSFEPGSVMKPLVVAQALELGLTTDNEVHSCEKSGRYQVGPSQYIHDDHPREFATTAEILIYSNNICTFKLAKTLGKNKYYDFIRSLGIIGSPAPFSFPGYAHGAYPAEDKITMLHFATISFGQGMRLNPLEISQIYASFANGGFTVEPYLVEKITSSDGQTVYQKELLPKKRIISMQTAKKMRQILKRTVNEGTGVPAKISGYSTAGKTGTAEKFDLALHKYSDNKRVASFAGFAPAEDPRIVIYVVIDEPGKKPFYGGTWAAPAFAEIAAQTLSYLNISKDQDYDKPETHPLSQNDKHPSPALP